MGLIVYVHNLFGVLNLKVPGQLIWILAKSGERRHVRSLLVTDAVKVLAG